MTTPCPACGAPELATFYSVDAVPVNSCLLLRDETAARDFPHGELRISVCHSCGFIMNTAFDPAQTTYSTDYEETQGFSPRFRSYVADLAADWVKRYDLADRTVVEIGCGKGEFLAELIRAGVSHGVGIDPALALARVDPAVGPRASWIAGRFPEDYPTIDAAAVVCRHTLEHLAPVGGWLRQLRAALRDKAGTVVLFEVPDVYRVLDEGAFWDVYYEHCSYFSAGSLAHAFGQAGFDVVDVRRTFDDQYLVIEARPASDSAAVVPSVPSDRDDVLAATRRFVAAQDALTTRWCARIRDVAARGGRPVVWGASSKAVAFLAALGPDAAHVAAAVDINPHKQGSYLAGSGHRVVAPAELTAIDPALVVVMNPTYLGEITNDVVQLGLYPSVEAL